MIQIRNSTFETNSSSTHSLNICTLKEWEDWTSGKLLYNPYEDKFIDNYLLSEEAKQDRLKEYYEKIIKKEYYKDFQNLTKPELNSLMRKAVEDGYIFREQPDLENQNYYTYDAYLDLGRRNDLESYTNFYTSESGDEIVIFGEYGYDG